jgi:spermidine/putrescine transport system ATP-binding protein
MASAVVLPQNVAITDKRRVAEPAILLEGISKRFGDFCAVDDCSLSIPRGAFVSLLGPSGCGKTTLLRIIGGFERQDAGDVRVSGKLVNRLPADKRDVNTVFQRYALFPHRSVGGNIGFPLEVAGVSKVERHARIKEMLDLVHLPGIEDRSASTLSGGQAQRVALARALIGRPQVLLLDEPLAALDLKLRKTMQLELRRIHEELGTSFLYVTHDQEEALTMSDTVVVMNEGRIVQEGSPAEIYDRPSSVFASTFIGETNLLAGVVEEARDDSVIVSITTGHKILSRPGLPTVGQSAVVSVRPQHISINDEAGHGADNTVEGVVRRLIFLGNIVRGLVDVAPEVTLAAELSQWEARKLAEGDTVRLTWSREAGILLPEDASIQVDRD